MNKNEPDVRQGAEVSGDTASHQPSVHRSVSTPQSEAFVEVSTLFHSLARDSATGVYSRAPDSTTVAFERDRYRQLFRSVPTAFMVTSNAGIIVDVTDEAALLCSVPADRLRGKPIVTLVALADRRVFRQNVCAIVSGVVRAPWLFTLMPRFGNPFACMVSCNRSPAQEGELQWTLQRVETGRIPGAVQTLPQPDHAQELMQLLYDVDAVDVMLNRLLRFLIPSRCDFALVEIAGRDNELIRCGALHCSASKQPHLETLMRDARSARIGDMSDTLDLVPFDTNVIRMFAHNENERAALESMELATILRIPMRAGDRVCGVLTLGWKAESVTQAHASAMKEVASHAGDVLERLIDRETKGQALDAATLALIALARDSQPVLDAINAHADLVLPHEFGISNATSDRGEWIRYGASHVQQLLSLIEGGGIIDGDAAAHDVSDVVRRAVLFLSPIAALRGVALKLAVPEEAPLVFVDAWLFQRIVLSLVDAAIGAGSGAVYVALIEESTELVLDVSHGCAAGAGAEYFARAAESMRSMASLLGGEIDVSTLPEGGCRARLSINC